MAWLGGKSGKYISSLKVDGGASSNALLMQMQSDISGIEVRRSANPEATALGAAFLAGLAVGFYKDREELRTMLSGGMIYKPGISDEMRKTRLSGWQRAVKACRVFSE